MWKTGARKCIEKWISDEGELSTFYYTGIPLDIPTLFHRVMHILRNMRNSRDSVSC